MHPQARETKREEPNEIFLPPKKKQKEKRWNSKKKKKGTWKFRVFNWYDTRKNSNFRVEHSFKVLITKYIVALFWVLISTIE
jgi:hypothetical protein